MSDRPAHPAKATLLALADAELGPFAAWRTRRHIDRCWICRSHLLEIQDTVAAICREEAAGPDDVDRTAIARARWEFRRRAAEYEAERLNHQPRRLVSAMVALAVVIAGAVAWRTPRPADPRTANAAPAAASELLARAEAQEVAAPAAVREERFLVEFTSSRGTRTDSRELRVLSAPRAGLYSARWLDPDGGLRNAVFAAQNAEDAIYSRQDGLRTVRLTRAASRPPLYREIADADFDRMEEAVLAWMEKQVWEPVSLAREAAAFSTLSGATLRIARRDTGALRWVAEAKLNGTTMRVTLRGDERTPPMLMEMAWESARGSGSVRFRRESRRDFPDLASAPAWLRATALQRRKPLQPDFPFTEVTAAPGPSSRDLPGAEVEVLAALHRAGLCRHDAIRIVPGNGAVLVSATLTSEVERERIEALIRSVPRAALVHTELRVVDLAADLPTEDPGSPADRSLPKAALAEPWLRARMGVGTRSSQRDMFNRMTSLVGGSVQMLADAWALQSLAAHFPPERQQLLEPRDRDLLLGMVQDHAKSATAKLTELDAQLGFDAQSGAARPPAPSGHWQDQAPAVRKASQQLCEEVLRFFAGSGGAPAGTVTNPEDSDLPGLLRQLLVATPALADSAASHMVSR